MNLSSKICWKYQAIYNFSRYNFFLQIAFCVEASEVYKNDILCCLKRFHVDTVYVTVLPMGRIVRNIRAYPVTNSAHRENDRKHPRENLVSMYIFITLLDMTKIQFLRKHTESFWVIVTQSNCRKWPKIRWQFNFSFNRDILPQYIYIFISIKNWN